LDSLISRLEFRTLLVSFRAFVTRLFILDFRFLAKSFVIESVKLSSVANTGICKLKIDNIATAIMLAYKIAFMLIISYGEVLYYFYSYFLALGRMN
jgi:hypothetical protein